MQEEAVLREKNKQQDACKLTSEKSQKKAQILCTKKGDLRDATGVTIANTMQVVIKRVPAGMIIANTVQVATCKTGSPQAQATCEKEIWDLNGICLDK